MQIVSQAFFDRLREQPILHTSNHNRIAFITSSMLVVRQITPEGRSGIVKMKGHSVAAISLENSYFVVVLYLTGVVEVRRVQIPNQIVVKGQVALPVDGPFRVRVAADCVYVMGRKAVDAVYFSREKGQKRIVLQDAKEQPEDILISAILDEEIILVQYPTSIAITAEGKNLAEAPFERINTFKLIKDPLNLQSKEFLVVVEASKHLKVFDVFDLEPLLEMELVLEKNQEVQLKIDPLNEYLMVRIYEPGAKITKKNNLLRVNQDFYKGSAKEPFFLFDIEIGLKNDFILFPTHIETIHDTKFFSIDMCFFAQHEIRISTMVVQTNHRTKLHNAKYVNSNWISNNSWKDFFFQEAANFDMSQLTPAEQEVKNNTTQEEWEKFLDKFYKENLRKLRCEGLYKAPPSEQNKYLQYSTSKKSKEFHDYQDALNTLSGSSSFGSLKQMPLKPQLKRPFFEGQYFSSQEEESRHKTQQIEIRSVDSEQSQRDEYLRQVQAEVLGTFQSVDQKIDDVASRIDRLEQVHIRKLKSMKQNISKHCKETTKVSENIQSWCKEELEEFGADIKGMLKDFSSNVGRLEIIQIRNVKKLKKHYRDYLELEMDNCAERLERSIKNAGDIQKIEKKHSQYMRYRNRYNK